MAPTTTPEMIPRLSDLGLGQLTGIPRRLFKLESALESMTVTDLSFPSIPAVIYPTPIFYN